MNHKPSSTAVWETLSRRNFLAGLAGAAAGSWMIGTGRGRTYAAASEISSQPGVAVLLAGVSVIDITPPVGHPMAGYGPGRNAKGIAAPLLARMLVLQTGSVSLALVSCDLVWLYSDRIIDEAKAKWGLDHVILHGTHTHAGPAVGGMPLISLENPEVWYTPMEDKIVAAIGEARANLFPASIRSTSGSLDPDGNLVYNRRRVREDGTARMVWNNPKREPIGPVDPTVRLLRVDHAGTGEPRVVLVHFAAHPVVLGKDNFDFSPDFAGLATAHVEKELGNGVVAMFLQGGGGDLHPFERGAPGSRGHELAKSTGVALGNNALRILRDMEPAPPAGPASLQVAQDTLEFARRDNRRQIETVGVMAVLIDRAIALGVISGEPFVQLQLDLVKQSPVPDTYLLGYSYFGLGVPLPTYLPTVQAAKEGGYGAATRAFLEPAAGEKMIKKISTMLHQMYASQASLPRH